MSSKVVEYPAIWVAGAACSGCSVTLLNTINPSIQNLLVDPVIPGKHVSLRFHTTIMAGQGEPVVKIMRDTSKQKPKGFILLVDGSIPTGEDGLFCILGEQMGKPITMVEAVKELSKDAMVVIAMGTCAAFGGIPSGSPNPTGAKSVRDFFKDEGISTPLINVSGCPPHPDWIVGTIAQMMLNGLPSSDELDEALRPKVFFGKLIHDNCPRRGFFDSGQFARYTSDSGCLYEIGCKGPVTYADCPIRHWNNGINWCVGAGGQCIGCTEPDFHDKLAPLFNKLDDSTLERFRIKTR